MSEYLYFITILARALQEPDVESALKKAFAEIKQMAEEDEKEHWYTGKPKGGYSFDSPLRTHASALLAFASSEKSDGIFIS